MARVLEVTECLGTDKYLGLPSMIDRNKKQIFDYLRDRVWKRIQRWLDKPLFKPSREVMVKSFAQSIPTCCMSVLLIHTTHGKDFERMINSFW